MLNLPAMPALADRLAALTTATQAASLAVGQLTAVGVTAMLQRRGINPTRHPADRLILAQVQAGTLDATAGYREIRDAHKPRPTVNRRARRAAGNLGQRGYAMLARPRRLPMKPDPFHEARIGRIVAQLNASRAAA